MEKYIWSWKDTTISSTPYEKEKKNVNQQNRLLKTHTMCDVMVLPGFS